MKNKYENLTEAIELLKKKQHIERNLLNEHLHDALDSIKPVNLIKGLFTQKAFNEMGGSSSIIDSILGIATGYLTKRTFVGSSHNIFKNGLGALLQLGVQNMTIKNSDSIREFGEKIVKNFFKKKPQEEQEFETLYK